MPPPSKIYHHRRSHPDESPLTTSTHRNKWNVPVELFPTSDDREINVPMIHRTILHSSWGRKVPSQASFQRATSDLRPSQFIGKIKETEEQSRQDYIFYSHSRAVPRRGAEESRDKEDSSRNFANAALYNKCVTDRRGSSQINLRNDIHYKECKRTRTSPSTKDVARPHRSAYGSSPHTSSSFVARSQKDSITDRLYHRSKPMQTEGKERRRAIARRSKERHWIPHPEDFGKIPQSRRGDMYNRGKSYMHAKQLRVHTKKKEASNNTPSRLKEGMDSTNTSAFKLSRYQSLPRYNNGVCTDRIDGSQLVCPSSSSICNGRKIPPSRAGAMYERGISFLQEKQARLQAKEKEKEVAQNQALSRPKSICFTDGTFSLSYQHMPTYNSIHTNKIMSSINTIGTLSSSKHVRGGKKIPQSKAGDMYSRGMVYLQTKQSRLQSKMEEEVSANHRTRKVPPLGANISASNTTTLYDRGMDFLEAKATKLEEKRRRRWLDDETKVTLPRPSSCYTSWSKTKFQKSGKREEKTTSGLQRIPAFLNYDAESKFQSYLNQDMIVLSWIADVETSFNTNPRYPDHNMHRDEINGTSHISCENERAMTKRRLCIESEDLSIAYSDEDSRFVHDIFHVACDRDIFPTAEVQETYDPIPLKKYFRKLIMNDWLCCSVGLF